MGQVQLLARRIRAISAIVPLRAPGGSACAARTIYLLAAGLIVSGCPGTARPSDESRWIDHEYAAKAAYLYYFSTYIDWKDEPTSVASAPFVIGVFQSDPFGRALERVVAQKRVGRRPIEVRLIRSVDDISDCRVLFVPKFVVSVQQDAAIAEAHKRRVLVVGESSDFLERGGDVQFYVEGDKVRFALSAQATGRGDFRVSSKLLSLATAVPQAE